MSILDDKNKREFGEDYIKEIISELNKTKKKASGRLIKSFNVKLKNTANEAQVLIESEDYLTYIDEGRKAGKYPNINAIAKWAKIKGISSDAVFPIARSIYQYGIKPTNVLDKAEKAVFRGKAIKGLEDDIANNIEEQLIKELNKANK